MKVNARNLELAMASACMNPYDLCKETNIQYQTYRRLMKGCNPKPATVGRIARALNVNVQEIIEDTAISEYSAQGSSEPK
jgi:putative transcriptional regulator